MSTHRLGRLGLAAVVVTLIPAQAVQAGGGHGRDAARLVGRALIPVETYAPGPPTSGGRAPGTVENGITFPTPSQPVEGFSAVIDGRRPGEYLAMPDNGYGGKATSTEFLIRAYYVKPDFKTNRGGSGTVKVGDFIQFSDPWGHFPYALVRQSLGDRMLTGGDIDPESLQRDRRGDLWVGDEFGPWLLHFDRKGRLLEAPISMPDGLISQNNPTVPPGGAFNVIGSRGIEAMAITPNGRSLIIVMEGAIVGDGDLSRRVYRYDIRHGAFTRLADYQTDVPVRFLADAQALDDDRLVVIERDAGRGEAALARPVYAVDLAPAGGTTTKSLLVDLAAVPDPDLVSLPAIHPGDIGLGNPFRVTCESIESVHVLDRDRLMLTCDNNFPNTGRNPGLADDTEMIVVEVPGL